MYLLSPQSVFGTSAASRELIIEQSRDEDHLAPFMDVVVDPQGTFALEEVKAEFSHRNSREVTTRALNFGISTATYWLHFRTRPPPGMTESMKLTRIFEPGIAFPDRVQWQLYEGTSNTLLAAGGFTSHRDRFTELDLANGPQDFYLRIHSTTALLLSPRLLSPPAYLGQVRTGMFWYGSFYGIILAVAAYSLFLFFSFNDRSYLWYVLHLLFTIFYFLCINGLANPGSLSCRSETLGLFSRSFLGLLTVFLILFTRSFFLNRTRAPKADKAIRILFAVTLGVTLLNLTVPARAINTLLVGFGLIVPFSMSLIALKALKEGFKPARFFLMAYGFVFLGGLAFALTAGGVIPFSPLSFHSFQTGTAASAILLSIALGDRIRTLRLERKTLQRDMERVTAVMNSVVCGIFLIDRKSRTISEINRSAAEILGGPREKIVGQPCGKFIPATHDDNCEDSAWVAEDKLLQKKMAGISGEEISVLGRARPIELEGLDLILVSFADISGMKRAEDALRRSEDKYRSLFESSRDAVMLLDGQRFVDCNSATLKMFGCRNETELLGKRFADFAPELQPLGNSSEGDEKIQFETALARGSHFYEWVFRRMDGEEFPAEVMLSVMETDQKTLLQALIRDITQRKAMESKLIRLALTDPLTGADNRRSFLQKATQELGRARRYQRPLAFFMIDVDHFKVINDTHGHAVGDKALKALVAQSLQTLRSTDVFGRLGGEEFAVVLPETDLATARNIAERLRRDLAEVSLEAKLGGIHFTISVGVAVLEDDDESLEKIMNRADSALLLAKDGGRNRVVNG